MKKAQVFLLIITLLMVTDVPSQAMESSGKAKTEISIFGKKRKGYKPKRGGLFNTGLFRKKNPCGCPNH